MSVISYLENRAALAVLSDAEQSSITTSITTIKTRLKLYFPDNLSDQFRFGSSTRGTILPRSMDENSDIDYMVVFSDHGYTPQTYLDRLKRFAEFYYSSSDIKQSSPTIVLQLNHIKFDLVPALPQFIFAGYQIPNGPGLWQDTNPNDFNATLIAKNTAELHRLKPAIRLAKYWNATNGYVFDSFGLEKYAVGLNYYSAFNLRDYLFTIMDSLNLGIFDAQWRRDRVERAKTIIAEVRSLETENYPHLAEAEVKKLIPG